MDPNSVNPILSDYVKQCLTPVVAIKKRYQRFHRESLEAYEWTENKMKEFKREMSSKIRRIGRKTQRRLKSTKTMTIPLDQRQQLLETYLWLSVCLTAFHVGCLLGQSKIFYAFGCLFYSKYSLLLISYFLIPLNVYLYLKKVVLPEEKKRIIAFWASFLWGIVAGYFLKPAGFKFVVCPPVFLIVSIAICSALYSPSATKSRNSFLMKCFAPALIYNSINAIFNEKPVAFLLLTMSITLVMVGDLQMKLGAIRKQKFENSETERNWPTICAFVYATSIFYWLLSIHVW